MNETHLLKTFKRIMPLVTGTRQNNAGLATGHRVCSDGTARTQPIWATPSSSLGADLHRGRADGRTDGGSRRLHSARRHKLHDGEPMHNSWAYQLAGQSARGRTVRCSGSIKAQLPARHNENETLEAPRHFPAVSRRSERRFGEHKLFVFNI